MEQRDGPNAGFRCRTPDCLGNAWEVIRTEQVPGGVRRIRRCVRCGRLAVTVERQAGDGGPVALPLEFYFQR